MRIAAGVGAALAVLAVLALLSWFVGAPARIAQPTGCKDATRGQGAPFALACRLAEAGHREAAQTALEALTLELFANAGGRPVPEPEAPTPDRAPGDDPKPDAAGEPAEPKAAPGAGDGGEKTASPVLVPPVPELLATSPASRRLDRIESLASDIGRVGTILGALLLALWLGWRLGVNAYDDAIRLEVGKFADLGSGEAGAAAGLRAELVTAISAATLPVPRITRVTAPTASVAEVAEPADELPAPIRFLAPLVRLLRPERRLNISGAVRGAGPTLEATLALSDEKGRVVSQQAFGPFRNEAELPFGAEKAIPTQMAAWAVHGILSHRKDADPDEVLGTRDWQSYARLLEADLGIAHDSGPGVIERQLRRALFVDPQNAGALLRFGQILTQTGDGTRLGEGLEALREARERSAGKGPGLRVGAARTAKWNPTWYQATYALAIAHLHAHAPHEDPEERARGTKAKPPADLAEGFRHAGDLVRAIASTQLFLRSAGRLAVRPRDRRPLEEMLDREAPYLGVVFAGACASLEIFRHGSVRAATRRRHRSARGRLRWLARLEPKDEPRAKDVLGILGVAGESGDPGHLFNTACVHARAQEHDEALRLLRLAYRYHPASRMQQALDEIETDASLDVLRVARPDDIAKLKAELKGRAAEPPAEEEAESPGPPSGPDVWRVEILER
ncbi:MAG: hypothetical protein GY937_06075 [bacterium]|nr:hypothetical protein [bacterium]